MIQPAQPAPVWETEGPVQAEAFVLRMAGDTPELTGPCGAAPWYLEVSDEEDPVEVVSRLATAHLGPPLLVHSTSWRRHRRSVILSFVVVIADGQASALAGFPIARAEIARNSPTSAPAAIATAQVIEHGLRHLAWLAQEDEVVRGVLTQSWQRVLSGYVPEPFQHLG